MPKCSEEDEVNLTKINNMKNVKDILIKKFLTERGITPIQERVGYGMYLSPFRTESKPSFKVDYNLNLWYDFGLGEGGSIIDLVMRLDNLSFHEAATKLERGDFSSHWVQFTVLAKPTESSIKITKVADITNSHLLDYLRSRAIDINIARHYCKEVHYSNNDKNYYAVGFANDSGGWELRNEYFQGSCSPKVPTIIKGGTNSTILFEGFINMLSYMTLQKSVDTVNNVCVLNSVNNLRKAESFLKTQHSIHCFLDNDEAGRKSLSIINSWGVEMVNHSNLYKDFNDLNDYLKSKNQVQKPPQRGRKMKF